MLAAGYCLESVSLSSYNTQPCLRRWGGECAVRLFPQTGNEGGNCGLRDVPECEGRGG